MIETFLVLASVYWEDAFISSGEHFKPMGLTVAHRTLPLGTCIKVKRDTKWTYALINDRGPCTTSYCKQHTPWAFEAELDLSLGTANALGMGKNSRNKVRFWIVDKVECKAP